jgi:hypothetical protein
VVVGIAALVVVVLALEVVEEVMDLVVEVVITLFVVVVEVMMPLLVVVVVCRAGGPGGGGGPGGLGHGLSKYSLGDLESCELDSATVGIVSLLHHFVRLMTVAIVAADAASWIRRRLRRCCALEEAVGGEGDVLVFPIRLGGKTADDRRL